MIHQWKGLHQYYNMEIQKFSPKNSKFEFWLVFWLELKSRNHLSFVNIKSYIGNWYINGNVSMSTTAWKFKFKNLKIFPKKFEIRLVTKSWNHLSFVNISPTLVIDTSMEKSSRVLQHGNPKIWTFFKKVRNSNFDLWRGAKITLTFVNISPTLVIDTSMERSSRVLQHGNPKIWFFFSINFEIRILTHAEKLKSS